MILSFIFPADNGSTLSSEAVTDSAASTDNNYGYIGSHAHARAHTPSGPTCTSPQPNFSWFQAPSPLLCVCLFIRTRAFQTASNLPSHNRLRW